ncbi:MAG: UvrB/UvrC motif-containing protein [Sedimentisphaerales bacterium]|nr:UvrB/UvrC motif-containing protein [Sedimentisphaerales bacterium]
MQCQICNKNEATIHLTEISGGERTEMHLCENCAAEQNITVKSHIPINELLSGLLSVQPTDEEISGPSLEHLSCPNCGFTLAQFRKDGVFGCPYDYEVFESALRPLIKKAHDGRTSHCGKIPSSTPVDAKRQMEVINLRRQLDDAVRNEDYELAAELRDKINHTEKQTT